MPLTAPTNTLAYHMSRPLVQHRDLRDVRCQAIAPVMREFIGVFDSKNATPETEALTFYGLNHAVGLIAQEYAPFQPLPEEKLKLVEAYFEASSRIAVRSAYYLILICLREARHTPSAHNGTFQSKLIHECGSKVAADWLIKMHKQPSYNVANKFMDNPPDCTIGELMKASAYCFYSGGFSGAFGGPAWGAINDVLNRYLSGEFTGEMMLDTIWTLSHNTGPIYNKGMLYDTYGSHLKNLLDVQRAGLIPTAILEGSIISKPFVTPELYEQMKSLKQLYPEAITDYVDWYVVEALGAVNHCGAFQAQQVAKYGPSPYASEMENLKKQKEEAAAAAKAAEKAALLGSQFQIMPGLIVKKTKPVRVAA